MDNTVRPRASGGAVLKHRRWSDGTVFLPMALKLLSHAAMSDEFARLVSTVSGKRGMFDIVMFDPFSQEARRRSVLYEGGLESPNELMPTFWTFGVTARFLSPFWRGPERVVVERIA
ncbi:MAG: hypothetical protein L0K09_12440, partial [Corynebacterium casei]|uniref:hypothetical protein n=1 Tax=Corynebacterium casei TaxID=160386 RepID=UPI0026480E76